MNAWIAYGLGLATPAAVSAVVLAVVVASERTGYRCTACGWTTGRRAALPAWLRWRVHRHVTRGLLHRCPR